MFAAGKTDGAVSAVVNYIEDVFSTYLYTGNGSTQTITNNIDLSTKGGIVWCKGRSPTGYSNVVYDTINGTNKRVATNSTNALTTAASSLTAFNTTGFSLGADAGGEVNENAINYVSWTFREQAKFFDIVTYTGNGVAGRTIAHNLGSVPGCIFVKQTNVSGENWDVYHRSLANNKQLYLNTTDAQLTTSSWNSTTPTSTVFTVGDGSSINANGSTYVAYLFAHDAGGFGLTGTDNVISCGSFTTSGGGVATVDLGYEPQWLLIKSASGTSGWDLIDNMRGMPNLGTYGDAIGLEANNSNAEGSRFPNCYPTATGFYYGRAASTTYIYIAIRRGPMKVPTSGTSVFTPVAVASSTSNGTQIANSFVTDMAIGTWRDGVVEKGVNDRLRGISTTNPSGSGNPLLKTNTTGAETTPSNIIFQGNGNATMLGQYFAGQGYNQIYWLFGRAPSFFDEVCYTGTGSLRTVTHNLAAVPELIIVKRRSASNSWYVYNSTIGAANALFLNGTTASTADNAAWNSTSPTSTVFTVNTESAVNFSGQTYVAYLFATCAGVSKVGSYTGNGSTQTINCGFTGGARFVLIKRTDATGDWYVYDTARGMTVLTDPYLQLNSTAAETATLGSVTTVSTGFALDSTILAAINVSSGTYIFLAIA